MRNKDSTVATVHDKLFGYDLFLTWALNLAGVNAKIAYVKGRTNFSQK